MKKLLGIVLLVLFVFSIYFSISNGDVAKTKNSPSYAKLIPMPVPETPPGRGC